MHGQIKTIVFDLDGTIYQNNHFHGDYIHFLLEGTGLEDWERPLVHYIDDIYRGEHLEMNSFYACGMMKADSPDAFLAELKQKKAPEISFEYAVAHEDEYIYLGDAWAVVSLIGKTLGLLEGSRENEVYRRTREKMSRDGMHGCMRLREAIVTLGKHFRTVLLTNSYEETALDFLGQLGFGGIFTDAVFSADKPRSMAKNLAKRCPELYREPESFLTIGDHAFNDLMPLRRLGCKTLWINPFEGIHEPAYDMTVHTLEELACCLEEMCVSAWTSGDKYK